MAAIIHTSQDLVTLRCATLCVNVSDLSFAIAIAVAFAVLVMKVVDGRV